MKIRRLSLMMPLLPLVLASCADPSEGEFPSLARRPIETAPPAAEPTPTAPVPADAALVGRIGTILGDARKGDSAFSTAANANEARIKAGSRSAPASEAWIVAQDAVSAVEAARTPSVSALAAIDALLIERLSALAEGTTQGGEAEIRAAQAEIDAMVDRQNARLDSLKGALRL